MAKKTTKRITKNEARDHLMEGEYTPCYESEGESIHMKRDSQSSVEISQDAKGAVRFTVKAYADSAEEAADLAFKTFELLRKRIKATK